MIFMQDLKILRRSDVYRHTPSMYGTQVAPVWEASQRHTFVAPALTSAHVGSYCVTLTETTRLNPLSLSPL